MRVFVYQDWPSRDEVEWTNRFSASLHDAGFEVFQEWTLPKPPPQEAVETALRESDAIIFLLFDPDSLESQALYFNAGVALFGNKAAVVVSSRAIRVDQIPLPELRENVVTKTSAERTADAVAAKLRAFEQRRVA